MCSGILTLSDSQNVRQMTKEKTAYAVRILWAKEVFTSQVGGSWVERDWIMLFSTQLKA